MGIQFIKHALQGLKEIPVNMPIHTQIMLRRPISNRHRMLDKLAESWGNNNNDRR